MRAQSIHGQSTEEIAQALNACMQKRSIGQAFKPTLAIVFISVKQDRDAICKILSDAGIAIFGTTTNGEFTGEGISRESVAILLLDIDPAYFTILFSPYPEKNYRDTTRAMAEQALRKIFASCIPDCGKSYGDRRRRIDPRV